MINETQSFCDWVTVRQTHKNPHKPVYGIQAEYINPETGEIQTVYQFKTIKGEHGTSYQIRSDGYTVEYSGNPGKFDQDNNVQGVSLDKCKNLINLEIKKLGLPSFDKGETNKIITKSGIDIEYTGAKFTRIDITQNFKTGSATRRDKYLHWIQSQNFGQLQKTCYQNLNTYFGVETESRTLLIYNKALEMKKEKSENPIIKILNKAGGIRYEMRYKKLLKTRYTNNWDKATQKTLGEQFTMDIKPLRKKIKKINISELPNTVKGTYALYLHGLIPKVELSSATFTRHKKILLEYGVDISNTGTPIPFKPESIETIPFDEDELLQG